MARDLYCSRAISAASLSRLSQATRSLCDLSDHDDFDIIQFLEFGIYRIIPDFYLFIERDENMNGSKAFVTEDSLGIVVSESVYNDACGNLFYAKKILAHEFGHVLLHNNRHFETKHFTFETYEKQLKKTEAFHSMEWQADIFGICLIVPPSNLGYIKDLRSFSKKYKMSERQAQYIIKKLNSIRLAKSSANNKIVQDIIRELMAKKPNINREMQQQLNLFHA